MRTLLPVVAIVAFAALAVSCGGGSSGKTVIGVEGGVATSDDGKLTLDIPPGALDEEIELTISAVSVDELPEALREVSGTGPAYRLEPDGLVFDEPVPVTLKLDRSELDDVPEDGVVAQLLLTLDADGGIEFLEELVTEATLGEETITVRGELSHFSFLSRTKGALTVQLEEVERKQPVGGSFVAEGVVVNLDLSRRTSLQNAKGTFQAFGKASTTGNRTFSANRPLGYNLPIKKKQTFRCRDEAGIGSYSLLGEATEVATGSGSPAILTPLRVVLDSVVECVAQTPTPTNTPAGEPATPTSTPTSTSTPVPPPPTNTPTPPPAGGLPTPETTTFTDPTGDEIVMGAMGIVDGGSDAAADIRTVRIGPSASGTRVLVTFGSDPSPNRTHFTFVVVIALDDRAGLIQINAGSDNSTAPEGGSLVFGEGGVLMTFPGPVPSGATLSVETIHQETENSDLAVDSFTAIVP